MHKNTRKKQLQKVRCNPLSVLEMNNPHPNAVLLAIQLDSRIFSTIENPNDMQISTQKRFHPEYVFS